MKLLINHYNYNTAKLEHQTAYDAMCLKLAYMGIDKIFRPRSIAPKHEFLSFIIEVEPMPCSFEAFSLTLPEDHVGVTHEWVEETPYKNSTIRTGYYLTDIDGNRAVLDV